MWGGNRLSSYTHYKTIFTANDSNKNERESNRGKRIAGVRNQQAGFADSTVTDGDALDEPRRTHFNQRSFRSPSPHKMLPMVLLLWVSNLLLIIQMLLLQIIQRIRDSISVKKTLEVADLETKTVKSKFTVINLIYMWKTWIEELTLCSRLVDSDSHLPAIWCRFLF